MDNPRCHNRIDQRTICISNRDTCVTEIRKTRFKLTSDWHSVLSIHLRLGHIFVFTGGTDFTITLSLNWLFSVHLLNFSCHPQPQVTWERCLFDVAGLRHRLLPPPCARHRKFRVVGVAIPNRCKYNCDLSHFIKSRAPFTVH